MLFFLFFFFNDTATTEIYTLSLHDALPILLVRELRGRSAARAAAGSDALGDGGGAPRRHHREGARIDRPPTWLERGPGRGGGLPRRGRAGGPAVGGAERAGRGLSRRPRSRARRRLHPRGIRASVGSRLRLREPAGPRDDDPGPALRKEGVERRRQRRRPRPAGHAAVRR